VAEDHQPQPAAPGPVHVLAPVHHAERQTVQVARQHLGQLRRRRPCVGVAAHRGDRRDLPQTFEDCRLTDVARVEDAVAPGEQLEHLGPQQVMRVCENACPHCPSPLLGPHLI
jgi:hypothetical protein